MSLHSTRFWYSGAEEISFNYYDGYAIDFPDGVSGLASNLDTVRSADGVGVTVQRETVPERPITFNGYIMGIPTGEYRRKLERAFAPLSRGRLWAETEDFGIYFIDCISSAAPTIQGLKIAPRFQATLTAPYPYWQGAILQNILLDTSANGGGNFAVNVNSDVPALYSLRLTAGKTSSGISLADAETGETVRYIGTLEPGQVLEIAADASGRVTAAIGGGSVIGKVEMEMKKLSPGSRTLRLTADQGGDLRAEITYREARAGV